MVPQQTGQQTEREAGEVGAETWRGIGQDRIALYSAVELASCGTTAWGNCRGNYTHHSRQRDTDLAALKFVGLLR